ncbi:MAG: hypothetical protein Q7T71_15080, partial [Herbiconiux sp.]|nr:hypothetical protein [Herbiconiux sp.]
MVLGVRYADTSGSFGSRVDEVFNGTDDVQAAATGDDPRERELVLSQANQFMIRINTYGPSDLDKQLKMPGYVTRVTEVITPKLAVDFDKSVTYAEQSVAQAGLARSIQLYATGAESLDADVATVLVTGAIKQSYPDPTKEGRIEYAPQQFRYEVSLVKTGNTWLVDDFTPVRGEVEGEPTDGVPTEDPASPDGSGGATPSVVQRYAEIVTNRITSIDAALTDLQRCKFPQVAPAGDTRCAQAPQAAGSAAQTLANSLRGAANPDSKVF